MNLRPRPIEQLLVAVFSCLGLAHAQDWRDFNPPPSPVLSPEEALKTFRLPSGFRIELVAAEPLVEDPVTAVWDAAGRLWVAEMHAYMHTTDGDRENEGIDRVVVLEDEDGDGRMDRSTVFLDGLVMPRSIAHVKGGVLIAEPPKIWFCQDTDGDLVCDKRTEVYDSYGQRDAVSRTASGLVRGIDNWIYSSRHPVRFQWRNSKLIAEPDAYRGDYGVSQDDWGRIYANTNSSWLHADLVPPAYFLRHPTLLRPAGIYERVITDQSVHGVRLNTGVNQGAVAGMLGSDGRLAKTTAATWPLIYRGNQFPPEFSGNAFIPEPAGNVVGRFTLTKDGIRPKAKHELTPDQDWGQREFLGSTDERFRPVQCFDGPDGALYVVDFYRGIIEYKLFVTPFLAEQIEDRQLDQPLGLGRIYRIVHEASPAEATVGDLVAMLSDPNGWKRDTAQRLLVERGDQASITPALSGKSPLGRLHALWTLEGIGAVDPEIVLAGMSDRDPRVRAAAVRIGDSIRLNPDRYVQQLLAMAVDSDAAVRLQVMLSLGEFSGNSAARDAMALLLLSDGDDVLFRQGAISGLLGQEVSFLQQLLAVPSTAALTRFQRELTTAIYRQRKPEQVEQLLETVAKPGVTADSQIAVLDGFTKARPLTLSEKPAAIDLLLSSSSAKVRERIVRVEKLLTWPGDPVKKAEDTAARALTAEERQQFDRGRALYRETCMPCHQIHGKGMASLAPPLVDSPWVVGGENRLIRIALNGLSGPLKIGKVEWNLIMPGQAVNPKMTDENLADVLTYIRREWENDADPVDAAAVARVRAETAARILPWTVHELSKE